MEAADRLYEFLRAIDRLLGARDAAAFESEWEEAEIQRVGWEALAVARRPRAEPLERVLDRLDRHLPVALERARAMPDPHITTFRVPELERWQHATAAALVAARWGPAGLHAVIGDTAAPLARRYFALLALAERHPAGAWPLFERYLRTPAAHHAFLAVAVEATRFYPGRGGELVRLFQRIRGDQMLRRFLGPKILESLYVLEEPAAVPLLEELCVSGHTAPDPDRCEVTLALVALRKLTGRLRPNVKFPDLDDPAAREALALAERSCAAAGDRLSPVTVI